MRRAGRAGWAVFMAVGLAATAVPATAAWVDTEWLTATDTVGTVDCAALTDGESRSRARVLSGSVLTTDLDTVVAVSGVSAWAGDGLTGHEPETAQPAQGPGNAWADPLAVTALGDIGADVTGVLQFPAGTGTGVYGQYARAGGDAGSAAAAGMINDSGAIALSDAPDDGTPAFATLSLSGLAAASGAGSVADLVPALSDASLSIGAVASSARLDGCLSAWGTGPYQHLARDYFLAGLALEAASPPVAAVGTSVIGAIAELDAEVASVGASGQLLQSLTAVLAGGLTVPGVTGLGTPTVKSLTLTPDFTSVASLVAQWPLGPAGELGSVDIGTGAARLDLGAVLGPAGGPSSGLNGQPPNTTLLADPGSSTVAAAVRQLLAGTGGLAEQVDSVIGAALGAVAVTLVLAVPVTVLGGVDAGAVVVTVSDLLGSRPNVSGGFEATTCTLGGLLCGLVKTAVDTLLDDGLVDGVLTALTTLTPQLAAAVRTALRDATDATRLGLASMLGQGGSLTDHAADALSSALDALFGAGGLLAVTVNNQNAPDPAVAVAGNAEPAWAADLPGERTSPYRSGVYRVSALRIASAGALGTVLMLDLATSSVGPNGP